MQKFILLLCLLGFHNLFSQTLIQGIEATNGGQKSVIYDKNDKYIYSQVELDIQTTREQNQFFFTKIDSAYKVKWSQYHFKKGVIMFKDFVQTDSHLIALYEVYQHSNLNGTTLGTTGGLMICFDKQGTFLWELPLEQTPIKALFKRKSNQLFLVFRGQRLSFALMDLKTRQFVKQYVTDVKGLPSIFINDTLLNGKVDVFCAYRSEIDFTKERFNLYTIDDTFNVEKKWQMESLFRAQSIHILNKDTFYLGCYFDRTVRKQICQLKRIQNGNELNSNLGLLPNFGNQVILKNRYFIYWHENILYVSIIRFPDAKLSLITQRMFDSDCNLLSYYLDKDNTLITYFEKMQRDSNGRLTLRSNIGFFEVKLP